MMKETKMIDANAKKFFDDLDAIRLPQTGVGGGVAAYEVPLVFPVRKPKRTEFFKTHTDPNMRLPTTVFIDRDDRDTVFYVPPAMRGALLGEAKSVLLLPTITTQNVVMIWPITLPLDDGRRNDWLETAREAADLGRTDWVRMPADMALGAYRVYRAEGALPEPQWPDMPLNDMLAIAFKDRIIDRDDHPIVRRLRGLI
jgi:hypothetical protein